MPGPSLPLWRRTAPVAAALLVAAAVLLASATSPLDILRYTAYATLSVIAPGTLVYRALRRRPHTFVEDVAMGAAFGLALELAGWALLSALHLQAVMWLWPLLVYAPFVAVPRLRRHWRVGAYPARPTQAWSWTVAGAVSFFSLYLYGAFFAQNPIVPDREDTTQFLDLPYQLSLAGAAKHQFPLDLPQVAGEPLHYHWFAFVHLAMGSLISGIDLPVLTTRLMVLAVSALTIVLLAVVAWRVTGRAVAGAVAALLFGVVGDFDFVAAPSPPFGTQVTFVVWSSLSMTYSWALLVALVGLLADRLPKGDGEERLAPIGPGAWALAGIVAVASSAAKASSLPVVLGGLMLAGSVVLLRQRRIPWPIVGLGILVGGAQLTAVTTVFASQAYGIGLAPLANINYYWADARGPGKVVLFVVVFVALLLRLQLRAAGIVPLVRLRRGSLTPVQWFLLGGAIAGPVLYLMLRGYAATWFTRAGFPFSLILSAWGFTLVLDRAELSPRGRRVFAACAAAFAVVLTVVSSWWAADQYPDEVSWAPLGPMLGLATVLAVVGLVGALAWRRAQARLAWLRGRGGLAVLTAVLLAGAAGLPLDVRQSWGVAGGPYGEKAPVPASHVQAARWVRDHSDPADVIATNQHCAQLRYECETATSFWLSAYSERPVLIEGWSFAPRIQPRLEAPFWDAALYQRNEDAFYRPTAADLLVLRRDYAVRYLVAVRAVRPESADLVALATPVFDNGTVAVYELR